MAAPSVNKLAESFENFNIPPIDGEPTYTTLHTMHKLLNSNVVSVTTKLGCGTLGHLCIKLYPTVYVTLSTTRVVSPLNPGATPVIPASTNSPDAASIRYAHNAATLAFNTFSNVDCALHQQILGAAEDTFLRVNHKPHRRYSGSNMLDLLTHIYETYTVILNANWLANNKRFCEPYLPTVPIEASWRQIDDAVAYANAVSTTYSSKQVVDNMYQLVFNTGIFVADCREWNKRAADDKTLPHLKVFFVDAHREWRLSLRNDTGTTYGTAHNVAAHPDDGYLQQETVDAIANLATATEINRSAIAQLTAMFERLTTELVTVNAKLVTALQPQHASQGGRGGRIRKRGRGAGTTTPTRAISSTRTDDQDLEPSIHYC